MIELRDRHAAGPTVRLHDKDNIVIARVDVGIGTPLPGEGIASRSQVSAGHKISSVKIAKGDADYATTQINRPSFDQPDRRGATGFAADRSRQARAGR